MTRDFSPLIEWVLTGVTYVAKIVDDTVLTTIYYIFCYISFFYNVTLNDQTLQNSTYANISFLHLSFNDKTCLILNPELKLQIPNLNIMHTWPPLDLCVDPALTDFPSVKLLSLSKQWAADKRVNLSKMVAPQWCEPNFCTETCHGMGEGAGWPPTISLGSNRLVPVMKGGIVAIKEMKLFRIQKCFSITQ